MDEPPKTPIQRAFDAAGGMTKLAQALGKTKGTVNHWKQQVPAEYCPDIERLTGIRCEELRPDVAWGVLRAAA